MQQVCGIPLGNCDSKARPQPKRIYNIAMDHRVVAAFSIGGICLDVLGGLYLAYDLLGGQHGPLRLLTRIVTYSLVFGIGFGLGIGVFGHRVHPGD